MSRSPRCPEQKRKLACALAGDGYYHTGIGATKGTMRFILKIPQ